MIYLKVSGEFYPGEEWDDFYPETGEKAVEITTETARHRVISDSIPEGQDFVIAGHQDHDGFYLAVVRGELTLESAKKVLAAINKTTPDQIRIEVWNACKRAR